MRIHHWEAANESADTQSAFFWLLLAHITAKESQGGKRCGENQQFGRLGATLMTLRGPDRPCVTPIGVSHGE
jgi:hypothetical protein